MTTNKTYQIAERCPITDRTGEAVDGSRVYRRVTDNALVAYCNDCQDCGCLLEAKAIVPDGGDCDTCAHDGECYATVLKCKGYVQGAGNADTTR